MKKFIFLIMLSVAMFSLSAQKRIFHNSISVFYGGETLIGAGIRYNIYFPIKETSNISLSAGYGSFILGSGNMAPFQIGFNLGKKRWQFDVTTGMAYFWNLHDDLYNLPIIEQYKTITFATGLKYSSSNYRFWMRGYPMIEIFLYSNPPDIIPWLGLEIGYNFNFIKKNMMKVDNFTPAF